MNRFTKQSQQIYITIALIFTTIVLFESTSLDILIQNLFFNSETKKWLIDDSNIILWLIFYKGLKLSIVTFAICLLASVIFKPTRKKIFLLLSLIVVPIVIGLGKKYTNIYCPEALEIYGGNKPYVRLFDTYPLGFSDKPGKCFPAGHSTGGFALMALYYYWDKTKRYYGLMIGLVLGWAMGLYQMAKGNHFFSDTLITMLTAWLVILILRHTLVEDKT